LDFYQAVLIGVFMIVILLIVLELYNKAILALAGAIVTYIVLFLTERIYLNKLIVMCLDFRTLVIFLSIMLLIEIIKESGFFQFMAVKTVKLTKGHEDMLFIVISLITFIAGMILLNIASILILISVTLTITYALRIPPKYYVMTEVIVIDLGAMALVLASIPNILISNIAGIPMIFFIIHIFPFSLFIMACVMIFHSYLYDLLFGGIPEPDPVRKDILMGLNEYVFIKDEKSVISSGLIILYLLLGFLIFSDPAIIAISAAIMLVILTKTNFSGLLKKVDWETFFFIVGLFIMVKGLEHIGIINLLSSGLYNVIKSDIFFGVLIVLWSVGIMSGFLDNIALTLVFIPILQEIIDYFGPLGYLFWIALILGTNIGGDLTPFGSPTSLVALGYMKDRGFKINFREFFKISLSTGIINLSLASIYLTTIFYIGSGYSAVIFLILALSLVTLLFMKSYSKYKGL